MARQKPNGMSVTSAACRCKWLERTAAEPTDPVVYDELTGEYHITKAAGGHLVIYHCPFCGGAAPLSRRDELFAYITHAEADRLEALTAGLNTIEEAVAALGSPERDLAKGLRVHDPPKGRKAPEVKSFRSLTFTQLSKTADIILTDLGPAGLRFTFQGKYLGRTGRRTKR
jgi:hypothetical protein